MGRLTERDKHEQGIWVDTQEIGDLDKWVEPFENIYPAINKLAHYEDLEEQGRLIEQKHGYWETVVEVKDNTVCGNGVKIEYKRCSCCKNPAKFFEDDFCGNCGAKLDLPQPPKGE